MKHFKVISIFSLFLLAFSGHAQNLVPNPSFEDTVVWNNGPVPLFWGLDRLIGSPDYFSAHYSNQFPNAQTPVNSRGVQVPSNGAAYFAIAAFDLVDTDFREYLQVELLDTLVQGENYRVQFQISLADSFRVAVNYQDIGVSFGNTLIPNNQDHKIRPLAHFYSDSVWDASDKVNWQEFNAIYTANGGEKTVVIGNFKTDLKTDTTQLNSGGSFPLFYRAATYYIDQISVTRLDTTSIEESPFTNLISVYPNPVENDLIILNKSNQNLSFQIFNLQGQAIPITVETVSITSKINLGHLPKGIYLLQVNDGKNSFSKKIVKH